MAKIKQIGPGRKTIGTIDGITYVTRNGVTYARSAPTMPESVFNTPAAKKRQAVFKFVQMHLKYHLRTINQTFTPKGNGTPCNRYYSINGKALTQALESLAEASVAGELVTITQIETAISTYAAEHPESICIASKSGYKEVFLSGEWPDTITLTKVGGDGTMIIIISENTTTTISPDGTTTVSSNSGTGGTSGSSETGGGSNGSGSGGSGSGDTGSGDSGSGDNNDGQN